MASLAAYSFLWLAEAYLGLSFKAIYIVGGGCCLALTLFAWLGFPRFQCQDTAAQTSADAQALLAVLRADIYGRGTAADLCCFCRFSNG